MADFTVKVEGADELRFKLNEGIPKPLNTLMSTIKNKAQKEVKTRAKPHGGDIGTVANAVKGYLVKQSLGGLRVPSGAKIALYASIAQEVEEGRKPGHAPTFRALQRWAKRHGINSSSKNIALMRRRIKSQGTKGVRMMEEGGEATFQEIPRYIWEAEAAVEREWSR